MADRRERTAGRQLVFPLGDGDALAGFLHLPSVRTSAPSRPPIVLIPGLGGGSDGVYMWEATRRLASLGHPVIRLDLRGAGASRPLCRGIFHAGRSGDIHAVLEQLPRHVDQGHGPAVVCGFSLGGNIAVKAAVERPDLVKAAMAVSAPLDLAAASGLLSTPRRRPYQLALLSGLKRTILAGPLDQSARIRVRRARSVREVDEVFIAPEHGFAGASDYYARCSALPLLSSARVPTLVVAALDDPIVPPDQWKSVDWSNSTLVPAVVRHGGHLGFHGRSGRVPWHQRVIERFVGLEAVAGSVGSRGSADPSTD